MLPFQSPRDQASSAPSSSSFLHTGAAVTSELTQIKIRLRDNASKRQFLEDDNGHEDTISEIGKQRQQSVLSPASKFRRMEKRRIESDTYSAMMAANALNGVSREAHERGKEKDKGLFGRDDVTVRFLWD